MAIGTITFHKVSINYKKPEELIKQQYNSAEVDQFFRRYKDKDFTRIW